MYQSVPLTEAASPAHGCSARLTNTKSPPDLGIARENQEYMRYGGRHSSTQKITLRARLAPEKASGTCVTPITP